MNIEDTLKERIGQMSEEVHGGPSLQRAIQNGRARRRRRAVAAVGSGVATMCAVGVVAGAALTGVGPFADEAPTSDEREWVLAVPPEDVPYAIEHAVREQLPDDGKITHTQLQAYGKGSKPLPEDRWDEATAWNGTFMLGSGERISVELLHAAGETEGDPNKFCNDSLYLQCDYRTVSGANAFTRVWALRNEGREGAKTPGPWGAIPAKQIPPERLWFERLAEVHPGGDYLVTARDTIHAPTHDQAKAEWTLEADDLRDIATKGEFLEDPSDG